MNYSYLSDGTKLSALDGSGEGLVYRGPFVYRKSSGSNAGSSLTLESAAFGGGLMTPSGAMLYVTDYLGSVRAVVDGKTGELYKASDYSAFGDESVVMVRPQGNTPPQPLAAAVLPAGLTLRDGYTGKEAQTPDFTTGYTDFGARQYSPTLRRWMTPDPLSEKYYGVSPYAFCNNNPVNFVDPDGRIVETVWDVVSLGLGARSFVKNIKEGKVWAAVGDGVGIVLDAAAVILPGVPAGVGAIRSGGKIFDTATDVLSLAKSGERVDDAIDNTKAASKLRESAELGQEAHRQIQGELVEAIPGTKTEVTIKLGDKTVRKDAVKPDGTVVIIKPDTPSGHKSASQRKLLMENNGYKTETIFYDPTDSRWLPGSPTYIGPKR